VSRQTPVVPGPESEKPCAALPQSVAEDLALLALEGARLFEEALAASRRFEEFSDIDDMVKKIEDEHVAKGVDIKMGSYVTGAGVLTLVSERGLIRVTPTPLLS
jgi:hypothetical protein